MKRPSRRARRLLPALAALCLAAATPAFVPGSPAAAPAVAAPPAGPDYVALPSSPVRAWALRLTPGQDLRGELVAFARARGLKAGAVLSCSGSLTETNIRYANQPQPTARRGHFEIVSLSGTLDESGGHLHLAVSDSTGVTLGGHLVDGNIIYTTAEIVVAELPALVFARVKDPTYGYYELKVGKR